MRAYIPETGSEIFHTINAIAKAAHDEKTLGFSAPQLVARWKAAVADIHRRIEQIYLIEFLMLGVLSIERRSEKDFLPHAGFYAIDALRIAVGPKRVQVAAHLYPDCGSEGVLILQGEGHDREVELRCDLRDRQPRWHVVMPRTGLRRLLQAVLPAPTCALDETSFKAALNVVLLGPQPIFLFDRETVRDEIGLLRDRLAALGIGAFLATLVARRIGKWRDRRVRWARWIVARLAAPGAGRPAAASRGLALPLRQRGSGGGPRSLRPM